MGENIRVETIPAYCASCGAPLNINKIHEFEAHFCEKCEAELQALVEKSHSE